MLAYTNLKNTDFKEIHAAFLDAFSNYEEPFELTEQELRYMLERRGYDQELSYGAFYEKKLVGFVLNATGNWYGRSTAYDTGTGIVKEFQGQGIARKLFDLTIKELKEKKIKQYLLEVIKTNSKAIQLYQSMGFQIHKIYDYYVFPKSKLTDNPSKKIKDIIFEEIDVFDREYVEKCCSIYPSWQNSNDAVDRKFDHFTILKATKQEELIGYGVIERHTGDIPQLAIHPKYRKQGIGRVLIQELAHFTMSNQMKMINIQSDYIPYKDFFSNLEISPGKGQYEMILKF